MTTVGRELRDAFHKAGYEDECFAILFADIRGYEDDESYRLILQSDPTGRMNMSVEEFFDLCDKHYVEEGYGLGSISPSSRVWLIDKTFFIRREYDGNGYWEHINPCPPSYIDPTEIWAE